MGEFVAKAKNALPAFRKYLTPELFNSAAYRTRSRQNDIRNEPFARVLRGLPQFKVGGETEVYKLKRGVFEPYFVEESGAYKVLMLMLHSSTNSWAGARLIWVDAALLATHIEISY